MGGKRLGNLRESNPERYFERIKTFYQDKYPNASFNYRTLNRNKLESFDPPSDGFSIVRIFDGIKRCV